MAAKNRLSEELDGFERALAALTPCASGVDRDQLMFLAGRVSEKAAVSSRRGARLWPAAAIMSTAAAAVLAVLLAMEMQRQPPHIAPLAAEQRNVEEKPALDEDVDQERNASNIASDIEQPASASYGALAVARLSAERLSQPRYLDLQELALAYGVEALPLPTNPGSPDSDRPMSYWDESRRLLKENRSSQRALNREPNFLDRALFFDRGETL